MDTEGRIDGVLGGPRRWHSTFFGSPMLSTPPQWAVCYEGDISGQIGQKCIISEWRWGEGEIMSVKEGCMMICWSGIEKLWWGCVVGRGG